MRIDYQDYRGYDAKHYSMLSAVSKNPSSLVIDEKDFSDAMKMGDAVDILLFTPEEFDKKYIVATVEQPTASLLELANACIEIEVADDLHVMHLVGELGLWSNIKNPDTLRKKWDTKLFWEYVEFGISAKGKHIITIEENERISKALSIIKYHEFTKDLFDSKLTIEYQVPIVNDLYGHTFKILVDMMIIDKKNKIIYPFDLKTMSDSQYLFPSKVLYWRYDIQSSLYKHVLEVEYPDYEIKDFWDIVYSFTQESVLKYDMSKYHDISRDGFEENNREYLGWRDLADRVDWHREKELYDFTKEVYENNGLVTL